MSTAIQKPGTQPAALARVQHQELGMSVDVLVERVEKVKEVHRRLMVKDVHYGIIPGVKKDCLYKPGAEMLGMAFQLGPKFTTEERRDGEHLECVVTCTLFRQSDGAEMGSGLGSCSTREKKYAWRGGGRKCPSCGSATALMKSKDKPEWFCWRKKDGCGATFPEKDERITSQSVGRVANPDIADDYNTVRKMACKRAHVAAILFVTCASEIFTQDVEDAHDERLSHDPHVGPGQDPDAAPADGGALGEHIASKLEKVKAALPRCDSYDKALALRAIIGSRAQQSDLMRKRQEGEESGDVSPRQAGEIDKLWHHCDRQVTKLEKQLAPGPEGSFSDGDESREPGQEG